MTMAKDMQKDIMLKVLGDLIDEMRKSKGAKMAQVIIAKKPKGEEEKKDVD